MLAAAWRHRWRKRRNGVAAAKISKIGGIGGRLNGGNIARRCGHRAAGGLKQMSTGVAYQWHSEMAAIISKWRRKARQQRTRRKSAAGVCVIGDGVKYHGAAARISAAARIEKSAAYGMAAISKTAS